MVQIQTDEYTDLTEIGRGSFGVVYRAEEPAFRRAVAIKVLHAVDATALRRFDRERQALGKVSSHPAIAQVFASGVTGEGHPYLVMEFAEGGSLQDRVQREGPLDWREVLRIGVKLAGALHTAHTAGILHRDVKPANVLLNAYGEPRLADFGIATIEDSEQTRTGGVTASVAYAPPEVLDGVEPDATADVYALGATLHALLMARPPFVRSGETSILPLIARVARDPVPDVRQHGVPESVARVIERAMAKTPAERYPTAAAFGRALQDAQRELGESVTELVAPGEDTAPPGPPAAPVAAEPTVQAVPPGAVPPADTATPADTAAPPGTAPPGSAARRRVPLLVGAGVLLAVLLGLAWWQLRPASAPTADPVATAPPITPGDWQPLRDMPTPRQQMPAAAAPGTIWITGGLVEDEVSAAVEGYEPAIDAWKQGPDLPVALHHHMATVYDGDVVVLGGWSAQGARLSATTHAEVHVMTDGGWENLPPLRQPRVAGAAVTVGERIVVVGGQDSGGGLLDTVEVYDGTGWQEVAPLPTPREHVAAATDGRYVYVVGGRELSSDANLATVERYDPEADRWEALPDLPTARGGLAAVVVDGRLVAVGGEQPTGVFAEVEALDIAAGTWETLPAMRTPRHGLALASFGPSVFAFGGALEPTHAAPTSIVEVLDLITE